jgi:hypothetical protein
MVRGDFTALGQRPRIFIIRWGMSDANAGELDYFPAFTAMPSVITCMTFLRPSLCAWHCESNPKPRKTCLFRARQARQFCDAPSGTVVQPLSTNCIY